MAKRSATRSWMDPSKLLLLLTMVGMNAWRQVEASTTCPGGAFATAGSKSYYWSATAANYDDAMSGCPADSTLAVFDDSSEMGVLATQGDAAVEKYWTALWNPHKRTCTGASCDEGLDWLEQTDKVFTEGSIPASLVVTGGECIVFDGDSGSNVPCSDTYHFICQCDTAFDPPPDCPPNPMWSKYGSKYLGASLYKMSYSAAITYCSNQGGQLAQVTSETRWLHTRTAAVGYQQTMWLDVENPNTQACTSSNDCDSKLKNGAGTAIRTNTYMADHHQFSFNLGSASVSIDCVSLNKASSFEAQSCGTTNYALCETTCSRAMSSCPILSVPVTTVQNNWHFHISPIPIYHHRARKYCHDLNMELATFMPAADYDALQEFLESSTTPTGATWINFHNPNVENCIDANCNNQMTDLDGNYLSQHQIYYFFPGTSAVNRACSHAVVSDGVSLMGQPWQLIEDVDCSAAQEVVCSTNCVTQGANCPGGSFDIIGTTRYYWSAVAVNYDNAMTSCPTDSTLAIFEDTTVMAILAARGNAAVQKYWTALWNPHKRTCTGSSCNEGLDWLEQTDKVFVEGSVPGSLFVTGDECIVFDGDAGSTVPCSDTYHFICQCDAASSAPPACPPNPTWSKYGSKYLGASLSPMSYSAAVTFCSNQGGKLAQVTSEMNWLHTRTAAVGYQQTMWIDLENPNTEACTSSSGCDSKLKNGAGTTISTNTYMGDHNQFSFNLGAASGTLDCVALNRAQAFEARSCTANYHALCEATCSQGIASCPTLSVTTTTVQSNWHFYISPIPIYHHRARKYCRDLNMDLATFMPAADYDALQEFLESSSTPTGATWINFHNPNVENCIDANCNNKMTDLDGNYLSQHQIYYFFPGTSIPNRECSHAVVSDGVSLMGQPWQLIEDVDCSVAQEVVCSTNCIAGVHGGWSDWTDVTSCSSAATCGAGTKDQTRACDNPPRVAPGDDCTGESSRTVICYAASPCNAGCPPIVGWTKYGSKWYGLSNMLMTFNDAKDYCGLHADGATLATVATAADFNNVITALAGGFTKIWVDLHNPNYANCAADPSTCTQPLTNKDSTAVVPVAHMDVLDFSSVNGMAPCVRLQKNLYVFTKGCEKTGYALCESSCTQTPPVSCPGTGASLTMVNGKMYHGSDLEYEHKDVRNYCMDLDMELASVATQENYDNVQFFVDNHFPQTSYVNLHNPDGVTCTDPTACNDKLKDFDGNVITTTYVTTDVTTSPYNNSYNCMKMGTGSISRSSCETARRVICELGCVDGDWSDWYDNGTCSLTCGGGLQQQDHDCNNPYPAGVGNDCSGPSVQFLPCNTQGCPVNGSWSDWADSTSCTVTCGGGNKNQSRACDDPAPANGGLNCTGPDLQTVPCNNQSCPPEYLPWDDWGSCSKTCDYGIRQRSRNCSVPDSCGGLGLSTDTEYCNLSPCPDIFIVTPMIPYKVTLTALNQFLGAVTATVTPSGDVMPKIQCTLECLSLRATRHSYTSCNGFVYADGVCKLGYKEPNWVVEQTENPGNEEKIYFDIFLP